VVEQFAEKDRERWDELIESSPQATVFHQFDWLKIMQKHTNTQLILLGGLDQGEAFALIPFFYEEKFGGLYRKLTSPPYPTGVPYLGPVFPHSEKWGASRWESRIVDFQRSLDGYIYENIKPHSTAISTSTEFGDVRPFLWSGYNVLPRYTYIGDISSPTLAWNRFNSSTRRSIRKAENALLSTEEGDQKDYITLIDSLSFRYEEQDKEFDLPKDYLIDVYNMFSPSQLKVFVCRCKGEIVGGQVALVHNDTVSFWLGGVRPKIEKINVNAFVCWKIIQWASEHQIKYFDLFGANTPSISSFKSQFGFDLKTFFWIRKSNFRHKIGSKILGIH